MATNTPDNATLPTEEPPLSALSNEPWRILRVPDHLHARLAPAEWCVYEWTEYRGRFAGADRIRIGSTWQTPVVDDVFLISFENQLGLTTITPYRNGVQHGQSLRFEVLARKFTSPTESVRFLSAMLDDLFAQGSALPFITNAPTARQVRDSFRPPNDLFAFHFFRHHREMLIRSLQAIVGQPHRVLADESAMVRLHQVKRIEPEAMFRMLLATAGADTGPATGASLSALERLRPERVWQRIPTETHDTAENRFILSITRMMLTAIERLQRASWFRGTAVSRQDRESIREVKEHLEILVTDPRFAALEGSVRMPAQSRVLQRRDGYREMSLLWQVFQRARQPVLENLETAIDLGDVADLYEYWVLFELIERIRAHTGLPARLSDRVGDFGHPSWGLKATFPGAGTLHYNRSFTGYSGITLRPDYVWEGPDGDLIVMDAKFRMTNPQQWTSPDEEETIGSGPAAQAYKDNDIQKMHTYRDAIDEVRAAIVLYPGTKQMFRTTAGAHRGITLSDIINGDLDGIGAIPMTPVRANDGN